MTAGRRLVAALALACLTVLTVSACSSDDDPATTPVQETPTTDLTITLQSIPGMGSDPVTYTLTCDPVGGDLEGRDTACTALADVDPDPFLTVPPTEVCLDVIKGPGEITITGTWDGDAIDTVFNQHNSCESDRFDRVASTLGLDVGT